MHELLEYITSFDPGFASRIEGASAQEIERFEEVAGGPFPDDYRVFLELMGRRDDAILGSDDIITSAARLTDFYTEAIPSGELVLPKDCIAFAISGLSIEELFLDRNSPHRIFEGEGEGDETVWASSFRAFLYQQAFERSGRIHRSVVFFSLDASPRLEAAQRLLESLGLERLWFSDGVTLCYESSDTKVRVRQMAGRSARVDLSCTSLLALWRLVFRFARELDLPLMPQRGPSL